MLDNNSKTDLYLSMVKTLFVEKQLDFVRQIRSFVPNIDDAYDMVSDGFQDAINNIDTYNEDLGRIDCWVFGIIKNNIYEDHKRYKKKVKKHSMMVIENEQFNNTKPIINITSKLKKSNNINNLDLYIFEELFVKRQTIEYIKSKTRLGSKKIYECRNKVLNEAYIIMNNIKKHFHLIDIKFIFKDFEMNYEAYDEKETDK